MEIQEVNGNIHFNVAKSDRLYTFVAPKGGTFGEAYDAAFKVLEHILEMSKAAVEKAKPVEQPAQAAPEVQGEVTNGTEQS